MKFYILNIQNTENTFILYYALCPYCRIWLFLIVFQKEAAFKDAETLTLH